MFVRGGGLGMVRGMVWRFRFFCSGRLDIGVFFYYYGLSVCFFYFRVACLGLEKLCWYWLFYKYEF